MQGRLDHEHTVGADPAVAVAKVSDAGRVEAQRAITVVEHDEIIAAPFILVNFNCISVAKKLAGVRGCTRGLTKSLIRAASPSSEHARRCDVRWHCPRRQHQTGAPRRSLLG